MKHVLVTGAGGYIGQALAARLKAALQAQQITSLTLVDLRFADGAADSAGLRHISGDVGDPSVLAQATSPAPDTVFHLAGITSRAAQNDFALGLRVNISNSMALFECLRLQGQVPVVVCASTIAVYGVPLPGAVDDQTPLNPTMSYGAQKQMLEILLADYSQRGWLDGRAVRLSGIVARPSAPNAALSAFASDLIREPAQGRHYTCPVAPDATVWLLSLPACVECLLQAASTAAQQLPASRAWNLPALRASAHELVQAVSRHMGRDISSLIDYQLQPGLAAQFATWPPLSTDIANQLGMRHDGNLDTLVVRALPSGTDFAAQSA